MSERNERPNRRARESRKLDLILVSVLGVVAVGVTIALSLSATSQPAALSTAAPSQTDDPGQVASEDPLTTIVLPTPGPLSDDEDAEVKRADEALKSVVVAADEVNQRGDGSAVGLEAVATGWVLGEIQARAREQLDLGYRQTGDSVITDITTVAADLTAAPPTITLKLCVDVSDIDVTDAAGNSLKASLYNPGHPVAHIYGAVFESDTWKISTHEIPDVQDCPAA